MKETKEMEKKAKKTTPNQNTLNSETFLSNIQMYVWKALFLQY